MTTKTIRQWTILHCTPREAYSAWLDSKTHGKMINAPVRIDPAVEGAFKIWDGTITGETLELQPDRYRIIQSWRYNYDDWPVDKPSRLTLDFLPVKENEHLCKLRLFQSGVPEVHAPAVAAGWKEYYWKPMQEYFSKK